MPEVEPKPDRTGGDERRGLVVGVTIGFLRVIAEIVVTTLFMTFCLRAPFLAGLFIASLMVLGSEYLARR